MATDVVPGATRRPSLGRWFVVSCDLVREMEAAELDAPTIVLHVAAWAMAAPRLAHVRPTPVPASVPAPPDLRAIAASGGAAMLSNQI
jgi:hypothetical protein